MNNSKKDILNGKNHPTSEILYVGIGASAGGLDALKKLLTNIPEKSGMAFIIVQHMDPIHKSGLVNILSRYTTLEVSQVEDGIQVMADHVYVIPPNKDMGILNGKLQLLEPVEPHGLRLPINYFFTSLAQDQKDNTAGIILSGFGSDGSIGLKAIKSYDGISIVQDPSTAASEGMPTSAINTGIVDMVMAPEEMAEKLIAYNKSSSKILKKILTPEDVTVQALRKIFILIRNKTGHDFSQYKKSTVYRRIGRRINIHQIEEMPQYLRYLQENPNEIDLLFKEFLINVTNFFRDPKAFESLKKSLKELINEKPDMDILRVWVPGCSTGEEVYSIAILIKEILDDSDKKLEIQIFGTDLDIHSIEIARKGVYSNISADMSPERLNKFFYKSDNIYTIRNEIRDMVVFANHNVIKDPPFTKLDVISCRNLLIYLETNAQEKVLSNFNFALKKDGILFLGPSESIGEFIDAFSVFDKKWKIFKCVKSDPFGLDFMKTYPVFNQKTSPLSSWNSKFETDTRKPSQIGLNVTDIAEKKLIDIFAPPSALINDVGDILYIHGRLGNYIEPSPGKAHMNIIEMAREQIKLDMSSAIQNAISSDKEVVFEKLKINDGHGMDHFIKMTVKPFNDPMALNGLLIVSFEELKIQESNKDDQIKLDPLSKCSDHINALENELKMTKERLNITIEKMTTSNEELKSANEELQSMNEESQSTNEELETSKEELQSINEELTTVNNELQMKIDELSRINDDMNNLFNSTEIATVFVDNDLKIRRFTEDVNKLIKLIESDIGRPLSDIVSNIKYDGLVKDIYQVIKTITYKEIELETDDGEWYQTKIMPYKTSKNVIDGAVITFNNITQQKKLTIDALKIAGTIIETSRDPILILDKDLRVFSANSSFYEIYKVKPYDTLKKSFFNISKGQWDIPEFRKLIEEILPKNIEINDYVVEDNFPVIGMKKIIVNARQIYQNGIKMILIAMNEE